MSVVYAADALADLDAIEDDLRAAGGDALLRLFHQRLARAVILYERFPLLAAEYEPRDPRFPDLRFFPIRRFESYAVFYQPTDDGIRVARVLHTARNIVAIFGPDPPVAPPGS